MATARTVDFVMYGRYSAFADTEDMTTIPVAASKFSWVDLQVWRGGMADASWTFTFKLQESMDREVWDTLVEAPVGANEEVRISGSLTKAWLRALVVLGAPTGFPMVLGWAVGQLVYRKQPVA